MTSLFTTPLQGLLKYVDILYKSLETGIKYIQPEQSVQLFLPKYQSYRFVVSSSDKNIHFANTRSNHNFSVLLNSTVKFSSVMLDFLHFYIQTQLQTQLRHT